MSSNIQSYAVFKERPLVLCNNNFMVYGNLSEKAFAEICLLTGDVKGMMMVTIKSTDEGNAVLRENEFKTGLYQALEYACEQIERYNRK